MEHVLTIKKMSIAVRKGVKMLYKTYTVVYM